jgi:hypothetical protein
MLLPLTSNLKNGAPDGHDGEIFFCALTRLLPGELARTGESGPRPSDAASEVTSRKVQDPSPPQGAQESNGPGARTTTVRAPRTQTQLGIRAHRGDVGPSSSCSIVPSPLQE